MYVLYNLLILHDSLVMYCEAMLDRDHSMEQLVMSGLVSPASSFGGAYVRTLSLQDCFLLFFDAVVDLDCFRLCEICV